MIINYSELEEEGISSISDFFHQFETVCLDVHMPQLLKSLQDQDWVQAWQSVHMLKGALTYLKAEIFYKSAFLLQNFLNSFICSVENHDQSAGQRHPILSYWMLLNTFDDIQKIQAYEYSFQVINDARYLKKEIQKQTNSIFPQNIYLEESNHYVNIAQMIRQIQMQLKEKIKNLQIINPPQNTDCKICIIQ